jgi:NADPH-dependent 7-cyano-7-deazaguanine reductase QueF
MGHLQSHVLYIPGGSFWALKHIKLSFGLFRSLNGSHKLVAQSIKAKSMIKNKDFTLYAFSFPEAAAW